MTERHLHRWLEAWGYTDAPDSLHLSGDSVPAEHVYHRELQGLLDPDGAIRARAVFDVDGVPTVCFLTQDGRGDDVALDAIRQRIWNQNLISIVLTIEAGAAHASPVGLRDAPTETLPLSQARPDGPFSRADVQSGEVFVQRPDWFSTNERVDVVLLENLRVMVLNLQKHGLSKLDAQLLMAQVMFVSYLEHRGIVGERYRAQNNVESLFTLIGRGDLTGINVLLQRLKKDFNGDLLEPNTDGGFWKQLPKAAFGQLHAFLQRVDMSSHQQDFWNYDFRFIPVELISGIYESFLADDKREMGAYYTPRHLAMLVVDTALAQSKNVHQERIYDGACGSGILLTTAFRRLLSKAEAQRGKQLEFSERVKLLKDTIFGSDLNESACRVTAFSLYLSVLEGLDPSDLAILTAAGNSLLPKLQQCNLRHSADGDFFSPTNPHATSRSFTIFLSNPPWVEPKKTVTLTSDTWAAAQPAKIPRRNTAGAFVLRAIDCVAPDATLCFILPVSLLAAPSSRAFVREVLARYRIESLINFGDLRKLLFAAAKQPCIVLVAKPRSDGRRSPAPDETIEYTVPKADLSFAFGRLTLHGNDRHHLRAQSLAHDNELLTNFFWGTPSDVALLATLRARGTFGDLLAHRPGWRNVKGFHARDRAVLDPPSSAPLWRRPYLDAKRFGLYGPLLDESLLGPFPKTNLPTVARIPPDLMQAFDGPRIVFADGMTTDREVKAAFSSAPFSFQSSLGVIVAPPADEDLLRFVALYLASDFVRYALLLTAYQISVERERVALRDLAGLPFVAPDQHADPVRAAQIVREVAKQMRALERTPALKRAARYGDWAATGQALIAEYLGLSVAQTARIAEVTQTVLRSVQPGAYASLASPLQERPTQPTLQAYARALVDELAAWRDRTQGSGTVHAELLINERGVHGAFGILKLTPAAGGRQSRTAATARSDAAVAAVLRELSVKKLLPMHMRSNLYVAADVVIRHGDTLYLIKPLVHRFWLIGEAQRDAERIVRATRRGAAA